MNLIFIYTSSEKDKLSDDYLYRISSSKIAIMIECGILLLAAFFTFFIAQFNLIMVIPVALAIYNFIFIYLSVLKADKLLEEKSPRFQCKKMVILFFYELDFLINNMKSKNVSQKDINNWKEYYIQNFKGELSLQNFKDVVSKLTEHISNFIGGEFLKDNKNIKKFERKELLAYKKEYFPDIDNLLKENKINIKAKTVNVSLGINTDMLNKNLKILGLSQNIKNFKIITNRYYELVKIYHPDHSDASDAEKKLAEINKAYNEIKKYYKSNGLKIV